jgi:hypothetical protein
MPILEQFMPVITRICVMDQWLASSAVTNRPTFAPLIRKQHATLLSR